ncbi:MAG: hypothetical protein ABFS32_12490 [Bacteroidota bacterium]
MNRVLLIIYLSFISVTSYAQKDLRAGYIITNSRDTLVGLINFRGDIKNSQICSFYFDAETREEFYPFDIIGYKFKDGKFYVSRYVESDGTFIKIFAEYLVKGQKDLFYYRNNSGNNYLLSKNDSTVINIPYFSGPVTVNGKTFQSTTTKHKGFLKYYFEDCPSVLEDIEAIDQPDRKNLTRVTKKYHDITCGENSCTVYSKPKSKFKIAVEPHIDLTYFKGLENNFIQFGGLIYVWLPVSNENLYIKTGYLYSDHEGEDFMYKIPLQFEYIFPAKIIRPKFDLGFNTYFYRTKEYLLEMGATLAASGGISVRVFKFIYLDIYFESDILDLSLQNNPFFIAHSIGFGTRITF